MRIDSANYTSFSSQPDGGGVVTTLTNIANSVSEKIESGADSIGLMIGFTTLLENLYAQMPDSGNGTIANNITFDITHGQGGLPPLSLLMNNVIPLFSAATNSEYEAAVQTTISHLSMGGAVTDGVLDFFLCVPEIQNNSAVSANIENCINLIKAGQSQTDTSSELYKNLDKLFHYPNVE